MVIMSAGWLGIITGKIKPFLSTHQKETCGLCLKSTETLTGTMCSRWVCIEAKKKKLIIGEAAHAH